MQQGQLLDPVHQFEPLTVSHTFPEHYEELKCEEQIYVSDTSTESHYRKNHNKNRGKRSSRNSVAPNFANI